MLSLGLLPKPGVGPTKEEMSEGFLKVVAYAVGKNGSKLKSVMYFPNDPGEF